MQPFGRILELSQPMNGPPGTLRFAHVSFRSIRSATIARNVMHNHSFTMNGTTTKVKTGYAQMIQAHVVRNWVANHPKIVLPIVVFLLGSLTYAVTPGMYSSRFIDSKVAAIGLRPHPCLDGASEDTQLVRLGGIQSLQMAERKHPFVFFWKLETLQRRRSLER